MGGRESRHYSPFADEKNEGQGFTQSHGATQSTWPNPSVADRSPSFPRAFCSLCSPFNLSAAPTPRALPQTCITEGKRGEKGFSG